MKRRFILAALLLGLLAIPVFRTQAINDHIWIDDLSTGTRSFVEGTGTLTLQTEALPAAEYMGSYEHAGSYMSVEYTFPKAVSAVVLDADATLPTDGTIRLDVRGRNAGGSWQLWHEAPRGQTVVFDQPTQVVQYRLSLLSNGETPRVRSVSVMAQWSATPMSALQQKVAPTYRIHATREGLVGRRTANGHVIRPRDHFVALPSWRSLSSYRGYEYQVRLSFKGRSVVVPVWDVGPWNTHDDYWSVNRQMWRDLPRGMPEAQAAYQWGYNGGRDEFGRYPNLPNGIDIADGTFWDSLGMVGWDWVDVTFLWEGTDPGPGAPVTEPGAAPEPPKPTATPTPLPAMPAPPQGAIVVDNTGGGFQEVSGTWFNSVCGIGDAHRWTYTAPNASIAENVGVWNAPISSMGFYEVYVLIPACGKPATRAARYSIDHEGSTTTVIFDQEAHQNMWTSLGTYYFKPGQGQHIALDDLTGERGLAIRYDAVAFVPRADQSAPSARIESIKDLGAGRFEVQWNGFDDTGVASFDVQVQRDGGEWVDWQAPTTELSGVYLVEDAEPAVYGFRVRARDWAGNTGPYPDQPHMTSAQAAPAEN